MTGDPIGNLVLLLEAKLAAEAAVLKLARGACKASPAATAGLLKAIGLLRQIANLADPIAPEPEPDGAGGNLAGPASRIWGQMASLQEFQYKSHDVLVLKGSLSGERTFQVSGLNPMNLAKRPFLVLKILVRHALTHPGRYMSVKEIVNALLEDPTRKETGMWEDVIPEDVHRAIGMVREAIEREGGNPRLIERSGSYAGGFRISTPPWNIILEDLDIE